MYDVVIVGAGPTGLAAGTHSALFGLHTLVLEASEKTGGIAIRAQDVDNYPGFPQKISGMELMEKMTCQAERLGVDIHTSEEVVDLSLYGKDKVIETIRGVYSSKALILAAGCGMKGLGMKGETWLGGGVAYCLECGEPFFKGKDVVIVGGASESVLEALHLTKIAANVRMVSHANMITIDEQMKKRLETEGVQLIEGFVGEAIDGKPPLKQLILRHLKDSTTSKIETNIVFVVGGTKPFVSVLRNAGIATHRLGCVIVDEFGRTNIEGVFAAGGCASTVKDIIPACVGDGTMVATCACLHVKYGR
ncbi:MAG: Sulfide dehydrogenase subunit alpha precursor [Candidatus Bathyarchaeota archaeon BA1]|nr:MAG: Sulfide dehydrogenase subunit alpha precursor [Candidatus Bathyarchaeota archaeon BA1]